MPIALVDGKKLVELLVGKQLGVTVNQVPVLDLDLESLSVDGVPDRSQESDRYLSLWPLPGGDWLAALNAMVAHVADELPVADEMVDWMKAHFPSVESTKVTNSYVNLVCYAGLIAYDGSRLIVTEEGAAYLENAKRTYLPELFSQRFVEMEETLAILRESPATLDEVHDQLTRAIGVEWATTMQTKYRLEWLRLLGALERDREGTWRVVE